MINRFQQGGGFDSFFTIYKPILIESPKHFSESKKTESKKEDSEKGKLSEKDLFNMLEKLDGLPNEMQALTSNLANMIEVNKLMGNDDIRDITLTYVKNLYSLKEVKYNKEAFDNAYNLAVANKSLSDPAIINGFVQAVSTKDGKLHSFNPEQWKQVENSGKYQIATVGNVLWMRGHLPLYVNRNDLFRVVEGSIGIEEVHNMIKSRFQDIGKAETSTDTIIPKEVANGQQILEQMIGLGPEGYYKFTLLLSSADLSLINATLEYIYSTLHPNAIARLALATKDGTTESTLKLIQSMILGKVDSKVINSVSYVGNKSINKPKEGTSGDEDNYATKIVKGYGTPEDFPIDLGDGNTTFVHANIMPFKGGNNDSSGGESKPISMLMEGSLGSLLDLRSMSIGGGLVSSYNLKHIINTDAKVRTLDYPCIVNNDGSIVPAFSKDVRERKAKAEAALKLLGINPYNYNLDYISQNYLAINQAYQNQQLPAPYNSDGTTNNKTWARFAVIAVATDGQVAKNADKSLLKEITDDHSVESIITSIQDFDKNYNPDVSGVPWNNDTFYEGTLWIRLMPGYNAATATLRADASVTRQRDELDLALANRATLTTQQFY